MDNEIEQKTIEIAKELCKLSDEELLNLPKIDDYKFIDEIENYDFTEIENNKKFK